jgi:hypothetical protein
MVQHTPYSWITYGDDRVSEQVLKAQSTSKHMQKGTWSHTSSGT